MLCIELPISKTIMRHPLCRDVIYHVSINGRWVGFFATDCFGRRNKSRLYTGFTFSLFHLFIFPIRHKSRLYTMGGVFVIPHRWLYITRPTALPIG